MKKSNLVESFGRINKFGKYSMKLNGKKNNPLIRYNVVWDAIYNDYNTQVTTTETSLLEKSIGSLLHRFIGQGYVNIFCRKNEIRIIKGV